MNYEEARQFISKSIPLGSIYGTDTVLQLLNRLDNPQDKCKVIHIAGTNGKGSVLAYLSTILKEAGYRVGRYSSPAVFHELEMIQINEVSIGREEYANYFSKVAEAVNDMVADGFPHPTFYEMEAALAFYYFAGQGCDFVVLETLLGGLLDATNVVKKPICSVITSISMDHMQILGNSLEEIATHKAGIIKEDCPVVLYDQDEAVNKTVRKKAESCFAPFIQTDFKQLLEKESTIQGQAFSYCTSQGVLYENLTISLLGTFQFKNACVALEVIEQIIKSGYPVPHLAVSNGFLKTRWHGRFECIAREPAFFIDGAHNIDAAVRLKESIEFYFKGTKKIFIIGILKDKEYQKIVKITAPLADLIFTVTPNNERALDKMLLLEEVKKVNRNAFAANSVEEAVSKAYEEAKKEDVILSFGSLSYLSEVAKAVEDRKNV